MLKDSKLVSPVSTFYKFASETLFPKNLAEFSSQFQENENTHFVSYTKERKKKERRNKTKMKCWRLKKFFFVIFIGLIATTEGCRGGATEKESKNFFKCILQL